MGKPSAVTSLNTDSTTDAVNIALTAIKPAKVTTAVTIRTPQRRSGRTLNATGASLPTMDCAPALTTAMAPTNTVLTATSGVTTTVTVTAT